MTTNNTSSVPESSPADNNTPNAAAKPRRFRWKVGLAILTLGVVAGVVEWFAFASDRSLQNFLQLLIIMATMLLLTIWWTFFSGVRWRTRFAGLAVLALIAVGVRSSVRVVGFRGEAFPLLAFRWQETAEDRAAEYWERQGLAAGIAHAADAKNPSDARAEKSTNAADEAADAPAFEIGRDDWSQYRGNQRDGIIAHAQLVIPKVGDETIQPKELWRHPVGPAWSSFAVVGEFAITQEQQQDNEAVVCYDLGTGAPIWLHTDEARFYEVFGGVGPRATPTIHDGKVYALGATGILNCLDFRTGEQIWETNILADAGAENITWAMSASPLIVDDMVIVNPGGSKGKSVAAYDKDTGKIVWAKGEHPASYSSPLLTTIDGVRQIVLHDGHGAAGINPDDGTELWRFEWTTQPKVNVAMPTVVGEHRIMIGSGYGVGSTVLDVFGENGAWSATTVWSTRESRHLKPKFNDFIVVGNHAYGLDEGIMVCVDLQERKQMWKRGRYGYGQFMLIDDVFVVLAESGGVVYVRPNPEEHEELYRWQAIEGKTWNQPAFAHGKLLVRNAEEAACYELPMHSGE